MLQEIPSTSGPGVVIATIFNQVSATGPMLQVSPTIIGIKLLQPPVQVNVSPGPFL